MRARLMGTVEDCEAVLPLLAEVLDLVEVSAPYPNRGASRLVRVYVEARIPAGKPRRTRVRNEQERVERKELS